MMPITVSMRRAINQAMGRVIRHRHDYGAIILADERFRGEATRKQISCWLRDFVKPQENFGAASNSLKAFFKVRGKDFSWEFYNLLLKKNHFSQAVSATLVPAACCVFLRVCWRRFSCTLGTSLVMALASCVVRPLGCYVCCVYHVQAQSSKQAGSAPAAAQPAPRGAFGGVVAGAGSFDKPQGRLQVKQLATGPLLMQSLRTLSWAAYYVGVRQ